MDEIEVEKKARKLQVEDIQAQADGEYSKQLEELDIKVRFVFEEAEREKDQRDKEAQTRQREVVAIREAAKNEIEAHKKAQQLEIASIREKADADYREKLQLLDEKVKLAVEIAKGEKEKETKARRLEVDAIREKADADYKSGLATLDSKVKLASNMAAEEKARAVDAAMDKIRGEEREKASEELSRLDAAKEEVELKLNLEKESLERQLEEVRAALNEEEASGKKAEEAISTRIAAAVREAVGVMKHDVDEALAGKYKAEKVAAVLRQRLKDFSERETPESQKDVTTTSERTQKEVGVAGKTPTPLKDKSPPMSREELAEKKRQIRETIEAEKRMMVNRSATRKMARKKADEAGASVAVVDSKLMKPE